MAIQVNHQKTSRASAKTTLWLVLWSLIMICNVTLAERIIKDDKPDKLVVVKDEGHGVLARVIQFVWQSDQSSYEPVWPVSSS